METTVIEPIPPKPAKFRFSKENAAEYGRRGAATTNGVKAIIAEPSPSTETVQLDTFTARRLLRVRRQLNMIDDEVDAAIPDPEAQDRVKPLVEAQARLSEQERFLANRPGPGTRKPKPERSQRGSGSTFEPVEE